MGLKMPLPQDRFSTAPPGAIQFGEKCSPRTIATLNRFGGVLMDPMFTAKDCADAVAAVRKVYASVAG